MPLITRFILGCLFVLPVLGCVVYRTEPRRQLVVQTIDAETHKPLAGVKVTQYLKQPVGGLQYMAGSEYIQELAAHTDSSGELVLTVSRRSFVQFEHLGYSGSNLVWGQSTPEYAEGFYTVAHGPSDERTDESDGRIVVPMNLR